MLRKADEIQVVEAESLMRGKGKVYLHNWLLPEEAPGHGRVFSKVVIPVGSSIGFHRHTGEFEAYYVIQGKGTLVDGYKSLPINTGDMHLCKAGDGHSIENTGEEDLVLMALVMYTIKR